MDLSALSDVLANVGTLAKEVGKGGGGSTEEPTVCMSLLPVALGVGVVAALRLKQAIRARRGA
jgi:hypothetical protein